ncbi:hypothetical protein N0V93_001112 [Gnomoniopsis smithogilvyi]|uniref:Uncharacterized protein n=1 Tax=Gnomoniopsis smithogilvyi TaxID=1191159 RepID=A0A9W9D2B8_9PEZI|nr:hypothetical protein N0V93_001112 [Gnomoniopsis smithogilvyi]
MIYAKAFVSILLAMAARKASALGARQSNPDCLDNLGEEALGNGDDAKACNTQLQARGSQACNANSLQTVLCQQGNTTLSVLNVQLNTLGGSDAGNTAESCEGVAEAVGRIFDTCFRGDNTVRGQVLAADNSNVLVDVRAVP